MCEREKMGYTCPKCNVLFKRYEHKGKIKYRCGECRYIFHEVDGIPEFGDTHIDKLNTSHYPADLMYRRGIMKQHKLKKRWDVNRGTKHHRTQPLPEHQEKRYRISEYDGSIR